MTPVLWSLYWALLLGLNTGLCFVALEQRRYVWALWSFIFACGSATSLLRWVSK